MPLEARNIAREAATEADGAGCERALAARVESVFAQYGTGGRLGLAAMERLERDAGGQPLGQPVWAELCGLLRCDAQSFMIALAISDSCQTFLPLTVLQRRICFRRALLRLCSADPALGLDRAALSALYRADATPPSPKVKFTGLTQNS
jgi:hypothetical protein